MKGSTIVRGWGAALFLAVIVVGVPVLLGGTGSWPVPAQWPQWDEIVAALSRPDDGTILLAILALVTWVAWLVFVVAVAMELVAQCRGRATRGLPGVRRLAAPLVAALLTVLPWGSAASASAVSPAVEVSAEREAGPGRVGAVSADEATRPPDGLAASPVTALPSYTVRAGDSLWSVAEATLGSGLRFQEIADLNYGAVQPDGLVLDASHWLRPGWILNVPADALLDVVSPPGAVSHSYLVRSGESLSSIAQELLGDASRYPEILAASRGITQPDGLRLTDPDLIQPGWRLLVPSARTQPTVEDAPAPRELPPDLTGQEPDPPAPEVTHIDPAPPRQSLGQNDGVDLADVPPPDESTAPGDFADAVGLDAEPEIGLRTVAGVGGMLAAGIAGLVALRRTHARRLRRPGERLVLPAPDAQAAVFERDVRAAADLAGRSHVDRVLRSLATSAASGSAPPSLRAARYAPGGYFEVFFDSAYDLPLPWRGSAGGTVWRLDAGDDDAVEPVGPVPAAPFPALVTVGQDSGAHLLVDVERLGCLDIRGNAEDCRAVLAALAIELGTSPWADDLQVTVVGALAELPGAVDTGRIRHVTSLDSVMHELEARAVDIEVALGQVGADGLAAARLSGVHADAWTPEILLVGEPIGPPVRTALERLISRVPGIGVAAVTTGSALGQWAVEIDVQDPNEAVLYPAGIQIRPQRLDADGYRRALELLGNVEIGPGPSWAQGLARREEPRLVEIPVAVPTTPLDRRPLEPVTRQEDAQPLGASTVDDDATIPRSALAAVIDLDAAAHSDRVTAPDPGPAPVRSLRSPLVRVLGPVEVEVASGIVMPASHQRQATELIAYLAFHPGASGLDISTSLWPSRAPNLATRRSAVSRARRWLGADPDGHEHLPRYWTRDDDQPVGQESAGYRLRGVGTDWAEFLRLVGDDVVTTPIECLIQALEWVRGPVFAQVPVRKYVWAEALWQEMTASIVDVAHEVACRSLAVGNLPVAREASRVARLVDPADERGWRDAIRVEWADGRSQAVTRLTAQLREHLASLDIDADPDTEELLVEVEEQLAGRARRGA